MAKQSSTRKRGGAPRAQTGAPVARDELLPTRLQAISDTWDYIDDAERLDSVELELQNEQIRFIAEKLKIPFLGAKLLNRDITCEDLREWEAWQHRKLLLNICEIAGNQEPAQ